MMFSDVRRILVIKFKHIGDVLLSVPALRAVHETFPQASIRYLLNAETAPMIQDHPAVEQVLKVRGPGGWRHDLSMWWQLRRWRPDMVIDLSGGGDRGALWSRLSGARYRIGTRAAYGRGMANRYRLYTHTAPTPDLLAHTVVRDLAIVRPFGIDTAKPIMDFHFSDEARADALRRLADQGVDPQRPYAVVHPTSRWLFKCADDKVMAACIDALSEDFGLPVVVTCGPASEELERQRAVLGHCRTRPAVFAGDLSLKALGAVISGARLYLGVDSAPSHMAAALDVPSIVLFGPTGAYNWGPWPNNGDEHPYPAEKGVQRAGAHVVVQQDWDCVPCGMAGCKNSRVSDCLMQTTPEQILSEARRMLDGV